MELKLKKIHGLNQLNQERSCWLVKFIVLPLFLMGKCQKSMRLIFS